MNIAFIGLGAVGREVLSCLAGNATGVRVLGALVERPAQRRECYAFERIEELLEARPDLVVECARQHVLKELGPRVLETAPTLLGGCCGRARGRSTEAAMRRPRCAARLFIPAGSSRYGPWPLRGRQGSRRSCTPARTA